MLTAIKVSTPEEIAHQSEILMHEFSSHYDGICAETREVQDLDLVFQGWAIQKIAFLQLTVIDLARCIREIGANE